MPRRIQPDRWLFFATLALCLIGAVMVFSASAVMAESAYHNAYGFLVRQLAALLLGVGVMVALARVDYHRLRQPAVIFTSLGLILLALLAVLFLDRSHATHRWMRLGPASLQPSEFAKIAVVLYLAWFLEMRRQSRSYGVNDAMHTLAPALGPVLALVVLVLFEPDMGTSIMIFLIALAMFFDAGLSLRYAAGCVLAAIPAVYLMIVRVPYRYNRLMAFLHPDADPQGGGFQLLQSLIAVGSGGFAGVGLMGSRQKLFYLPEAHTDFIFAVLCEELGFLGGMVVLALFVIYAWRGLRTVLAAPDEFGRLLALGATVMVVGQALVNLSVVLGMMPTKGIPLPFISYGGSSLVVMLAATGILLNISQYADQG